MGDPFDAVLVVSFGGPEGMADVRPFLENVLRGRRVARDRVEAVVKHYELFGGVSPLKALTFVQAEGLRAKLQASGPNLPVFVGMRNWRPYLADTLVEMADAGVRRALVLIAAAHPSYASCGQYRENLRDANAATVARGRAPIDLLFAGSWHTHPGFIAANADHVTEALATLDPSFRARARVVFTAHSLPLPMAEASVYREALRESAVAVAARAQISNWAIAYQSRSGRPEDPWLEPDICDYLRDARAKGLAAAVISPLGFVSDHIEVLYDLDHEAAAVCRAIGLPMARAQTVNLHPGFVETMADTVRIAWEHHGRHRVLPIVW